METGPRENNHKGRKSPEKEDLPTVFQLLVIESSKEEYILMVLRFELTNCVPFLYFLTLLAMALILHTCLCRGLDPFSFLQMTTATSRNNLTLWLIQTCWLSENIKSNTRCQAEMLSSEQRRSYIDTSQ